MGNPLGRKGLEYLTGLSQNFRCERLDNSRRCATVAPFFGSEKAQYIARALAHGMEPQRVIVAEYG